MTSQVVLLVEDNERNLKLARDVLEYAGFTVLVATSGEEAVATAQRSTPDVILMDLQLPGIDGHAALSLLRADSTTWHIPVVALTAFAMKHDEERAREAGCDAYLAKPIDTRALPELLVRLLTRSRSPR